MIDRNTKITVRLTARQWLTIHCAMYDAMRHNRARGFNGTEREVHDVHKALDEAMPKRWTTWMRDGCD